MAAEAAAAKITTGTVAAATAETVAAAAEGAATAAMAAEASTAAAVAAEAATAVSGTNPRRPPWGRALWGAPEGMGGCRATIGCRTRHRRRAALNR